MIQLLVFINITVRINFDKKMSTSFEKKENKIK